METLSSFRLVLVAMRKSGSFGTKNEKKVPAPLARRPPPARSFFLWHMSPDSDRNYYG